MVRVVDRLGDFFLKSACEGGVKVLPIMVFGEQLTNRFKGQILYLEAVLKGLSHDFAWGAVLLEFDHVQIALGIDG